MTYQTLVLYQGPRTSPEELVGRAHVTNSHIKGKVSSGVPQPGAATVRTQLTSFPKLEPQTVLRLFRERLEQKEMKQESHGGVAWCEEWNCLRKRGMESGGRRIWCPGAG